MTTSFLISSLTEEHDSAKRNGGLYRGIREPDLHEVILYILEPF